MQKKDLKCAKRMIIIKKKIELLYGHKKGVNWKYEFKVWAQKESKLTVWAKKQKESELNKKYKKSELKE